MPMYFDVWLPLTAVMQARLIVGRVGLMSGVQDSITEYNIVFFTLHFMESE